MADLETMTDKKEYILDKATELFAEHGYEGTSTRALAKSAGVNIAMISYYFGSKEKLFEEVVIRRTTSSYEQLKAIQAADLSPWEKLEAVIDMNIDRIVQKCEFQRLIYRQITLQQRSGMNNIIIENIMRNATITAEIIKEGIDKKVFNEVDINLTLASIHGTVSQLTVSYQLACKMMGIPEDKDFISREPYRGRLKNHLKQMLKALLVIENKPNSK